LELSKNGQEVTVWINKTLGAAQLGGIYRTWQTVQMIVYGFIRLEVGDNQ
jgi:hypothetical protein